MYIGKELFPEELWSTLEGEEGNELRKHINGSMQKKAALLRALNNQDPNYKTQALLQKIHSLTGDEDGDEADEEIMDEEDRGTLLHIPDMLYYANFSRLYV